MKSRASACLTLVALSTACSGDVRATEKAAATQSVCSIPSLRELLATDSSKLRRADRTVAPGQSTEGGQAAVFYAEKAPRLIRAAFFGEMGRSQEVYYLRDSLSFVRVRTESHYAKPIIVERTPAISSATSDTVWICGGRAQAAADSAVVEDALSTVRQLLRTP